MPKTTNPDIFRPIDVPNRLKPYVRRALVADMSETVDMDVDVRGTGYHYFGWVWRGRWQGLVNGVTLFDTDQDGQFFLTGQVDKIIAVAKMQRDIGQIFLEFSALGHFQCFGITGAQLAGIPIAPQALAPELKQQLKKLSEAGSMSLTARMERLADVLTQRPMHAIPNGIYNAIKRMEDTDGNIVISDVTAELGLADRQFRDTFKKMIGLTPKAFCKTLQINRAFNQLLVNNGGDLAEIAVASGFSDQAHFTRAFAEFLGKAPKSYLEEVEATLGRFVGQSRQ